MNIVELPDFGRNQLASMLNLFDYKAGVEVGVAGGDYSEVLCKYNPNMTFYGIDPWIPYKGYRDYARQSTLDGLEKKAHQKLDKFPNYNFIKDFSMSALDKVPMVDFVYLDANHQEPYISQDITGWWEKLKPGGILAGHDFARNKHRDGTPLHHNVKEAVTGFARLHKLSLYVLGSEANDEGLVRDRPRSWVIIK